MAVTIKAGEKPLSRPGVIGEAAVEAAKAPVSDSAETEATTPAPAKKTRTRAKNTK